MKPRLIACDIDGTLLHGSQTAFSDETVRLIRRAIDEGIVFMPASGRQYTGLRRLFAPIGAEVPYVAENGVAAYVEGELVFHAEMDHDLGVEIVRTVLARPECQLFVSGAETCYVQTDDEAYLNHLRNVLRFDVTEVEDATHIPEPFSKISAYHVNLDPDFAFWNGRFGDRCNVAIASPDWLDTMPFGVSKASGVRAVCERLGIALADCMAFGDSFNDVEMLEAVGCSYAMAQADDRVKAHATHVTDSVESVLAELLD